MPARRTRPQRLASRARARAGLPPILDRLRGAGGRARAAKRGLWAGTFTPPWDWRRGERSGPEGQVGDASAPAPPAAALGTCAIKGNISHKGERIYHLPGTRDYARTQISMKDGERMFCTEDEARAAGWRAPRG